MVAASALKLRLEVLVTRIKCKGQLKVLSASQIGYHVEISLFIQKE